MLGPRQPSRPRSPLLLSALLALWMGCLPNLEGAECETDQNCPSSQFCNAGTCREGARPPRAAAMSATASLGGTTASMGQSSELLFTVTNTGTVVLENVFPTSVTASGSAAGSVVSGPTPATVTRLIPGASASFRWTVTTAALGTLTFSASAQGTASDTAEDVTASASTPAVTVQRPAELEVSLSGPTTVSWDQVFVVTMVVTNRGDAQARNVVPGAPVLDKTGGASATAGATPMPVTIDGGANATFQLTFTEDGAASGTLVVKATASGADGNSGATVTSAQGASGIITVQKPAALSITGFSIPTIIGRGGTFAATVTVSNTGEAAANLVLPSPNPPSKTATGGADVTTSTTVTSGGIPGGGQRTFTWNYSELGSGTGTLKLTTGATGTDANTGQTINALPTDSNVAQVQAGGALAVTSFTIPATLTRGQGFTAALVVTNSGGSLVTGVTPAAPTMNATGGAVATTSTTFTPVSIAPGANHTFTFSYTESGTASGTLSFTAHASGVDSVSGNPVNSTDTTSNVAAVQRPAQLSITNFSIPANLSRGQGFQASIIVSNTGEATALGVAPSPNPPQVNVTGNANATTSSTPAAQNIPGGMSATFTWSYTETGTGTGTLRLSTAATGTDGNTSGAISTGTGNSTVAQVENPASLSVTSFTIPAAVLRGGTFSASMIVTNTGGAAASVVIPSPSPPAVTVTAGSAAASSTDTPAPFTIPGGTSHTFSWTFTENGTGVGALRLSAGVNGQDANSSAPLNVPSVSSNVISVQNPGGLVITNFSFPTQLSRGQTFTLSMTVQNSGGSTVDNVVPLPEPPTLNATGGPNATTPSSHAGVSLTAGASTTFTWSYTENGTGPGTLSFTGAAQGVGSVSGNPVTSSSVTTAVAQVQTPAALTVTSADITGPLKVSRGQTFTVQMVVRNTGQATANNVLPSPLQPTVQRTGAANASTSTSPVSQNIAGGASATFQWTFTENGTGTGTLKFTDGATGTDANTMSTVTAAAVQSAGATTVQTPAVLGITSFTQPAVIQRGTNFTLSLTVVNSGEADANLVIPSPNPPNQVTTGGVNATTSSSPSAVTLAGGANHTFTWTFTEGGSAPGTLRFDAIATGQDANSGTSLSTPSTNSNLATVQSAADLEITSFTLAPTTLSVGQTFTATITVHNRGGTTANNVLPSPNPPTVTGTGGANASTTTTLTPVTLTAGASQTFTWNYTESGGPGTLRLTAGATGTDALSMATVTAPQLSTAITTVQSAASLTVTSFTINRSTVTRGQAFIASMTVANNGQATANNVRPSPLVPALVPTGGANATTASSPPAQSIPGGMSATFTWSYTENGTASGTLKLNGGAQGTDVNSAATVNAPAIDSTLLTVQTPPALAVTSFTAPAAVVRGSGFVLTMVVSNSGQATANGVAPSSDPPALTATGGANAATSDTQLPANIPGGMSATFTWNYVENGTAAGTLRFATPLAGTDANTGAAVTAPSTNSNVVNVQAPANLVVTAFTATPTTLSRGQAFTASMTVQNQGGTTANNVLPSQNPPGFNVVSGGPGATTSTTLTPATLAPSASTSFIWSYTENGTTSGSFTLTSGATGTSAVGGGTVTAPAATTGVVTVQTAASLSITSFVIPAPVGASFIASLQVRNSGQAAANGVVPTPQPPITTGGINVTANGSPAAQNIPGGGTVTFSLSYNVGGVRPGTIQLKSGAVGADANSSATVTAPDTFSNTALAMSRPPPDLGSLLAVSPRIAAPGSTVTVTMEVKNEGRRPEKVAPPPELALEGPAEVELMSAPSRSSLAWVAPGDTHRFEWTYRAVRHGWVTFSGAAAEGLAKVTSRHLTVPAPWCAGGSSLLAHAGPARSGRCGAALPLGGSPPASGGAGLYRYEWTPGDGLSSALAANPTATPREAETLYELVVTDADGCQARATARAEVTDAPVVDLPAPERAAPGDRVQLARTLRCPAGGCADAWELGEGRRSTLASPVARWMDEGVHTVRYRTTDANGCEATAERPVMVGGAASVGGAP